MAAAETAGIKKLKIYHTVNIKMEFKHPKYYKELRKLRNNLDQVISKQQATASSTRAPGPGLKQQAASDKPQAGDKPQAKPEPSSGS